MNFDFMTIDDFPADCMLFPRVLIKMALSSTAKILYCRMLDEALINGREDENGIVYICFPIAAMSGALLRSRETVKRSLRELEDADLILRVQQKIGAPNRIYVLSPEREAQTNG